MLRKLILLSVPWLLAAPAFATEADFEKQMARGVAALEANEPDQSAAEFRAALAEHPLDPEANLFLGIALSRTNDPQAESVLKKALALDPDNQRTNLELGIFYFRKNITDEAADHFDTVIKTSSDNDLTAQAREYLSKLDTNSKGRRWTLQALTGMQYDSNVILNAEGLPLPPGVSRKSDWRALVSLTGGYSLFKKEKLEIQAEYNFFQSLHFYFTSYNVTQNTLKLQGKYDCSDRISFKGGYALEQVLLGGNQFDYANTLAVSGTLNHVSGASSAVEARYRNTSYKNSDMFLTNSERSGSNYLLGFSHQMPLTSIAVVRAGYAFDMDRANSGDSWDYNGNRVSAGVNVPLPYAVKMDLSTDVHWRNYQGIGSYSISKRTDTSWTTNLMFNKALSQQYSVTAGFSVDRTYSNVPVFDYSRYLTTMIFNMRF
jgi:tetratricopeptide (TPR) repeat protein